MDCKKCGKELTGNKYKKVAEWSFCLECFQALMEPVEEKKPEQPKVEPEKEKQKCRVCSKELEEGEGRDMLGLLFCLDCYDVLVKSSTGTKMSEVEEEEKTKPKVAQVHVDVKKTTQCHDCGRQIPLLGTKEVDGNRYCPDCYHVLSKIQEDKHDRFPAVGVEQPPKEEDSSGLRCQTCNRQVLPENLKTMDGFEICRACLKTDPKTALEVAKARHRKNMERMKRDLN